MQIRYKYGIGGATQNFWVHESNRGAVLDLGQVAVDARNVLREGGSAPSDESQSLTDQLTQLGKLHDSAQLDDEEFAAAKARLIAGK